MRWTIRPTTGTGRTPRARQRVTAAAVCAAVLGALALGAGPAGASARPSGTAVVTVRSVGHLGTVLVDGDGRTLYLYTLDRPGHVTCTGRCAAAWPPDLLPKGTTHVTARHGVSGLGTIRRPGGRDQVTYHRWPLYRYVGDRRPGQARGQDLGGVWFVVDPHGKLPGSASAPDVPDAHPATGGAPTVPGTPGAPTAGTGVPEGTGSSSGQPASSPAPGSATPSAPSVPVTGGTAPTTETPPAAAPVTVPPTTPPPTTPPPTTPPTAPAPTPTTRPTPPPTPTTRPTPPPTPTTQPPGGGVAY